MLYSPTSQEEVQHYTGVFSPQSVLVKLSDLTRHIVEMTDAHLQASDKHLKWELSQRDRNTMQLQGKSAWKVNRFWKSLKLNLCKTVTNECIEFSKTCCCKGLHQSCPAAEATAHSSASHSTGGSHPQRFFSFPSCCWLGCISMLPSQHKKNNLS